MARPQSYVHAEQPPPLQHDFNFLAEQALRSKCVFRVWQPNSASPLIWTNFVSDSGFAAPNGNLARLSAPAYLDHFRDNRGQVDWAEGLYMKQTVVDHILQKWRQTALYYNGMVADEEGVDIPEDDKSPWISTSKDLMWCVWETARRLAIMLANIDRTYREASGMDPDEKTRNWVKAQEDAVVHLSIIRHHSGTIGLQDARRNSLESHIDAKGPTSRVDRQVMSVSIQGEFAHAKRLASSASEILYYGRIFAANIASDLEWSVTRTPFALPLHFLREGADLLLPRPDTPDQDSDCGGLRGWLADLVWDALHDDFQKAKDQVHRRRRELSRHGSEPVRDPGRATGSSTQGDWRHDHQAGRDGGRRERTQVRYEQGAVPSGSADRARARGGWGT